MDPRLAREPDPEEDMMGWELTDKDRQRLQQGYGFDFKEDLFRWYVENYPEELEFDPKEHPVIKKYATFKDQEE